MQVFFKRQPRGSRTTAIVKRIPPGSNAAALPDEVRPTWGSYDLLLIADSARSSKWTVDRFTVTDAHLHLLRGDEQSTANAQLLDNWQDKQIEGVLGILNNEAFTRAIAAIHLVDSAMNTAEIRRRGEIDAVTEDAAGAIADIAAQALQTAS
ncbi:hypothetical protein [Curtobacterium sp. 18060]|uniref:hypothetical protein n=1 Tax=Curtobacterium sp. 18060 TaxID=2681408 RepID=UPI00135B3926|nr:hypothetical protein [Curtobacterium sp. 18060]